MTRVTALALLPAILLITWVLSTAQAATLGKVDFPNSGARSAQDDFIVGVLYLHSFEYDRAADAFQRAQKIDTNFAMAYWGEAMTYHHSLWRVQHTEVARDTLISGTLIDCTLGLRIT